MLGMPKVKAKDSYASPVWLRCTPMSTNQVSLRLQCFAYMEPNARDSYAVPDSVWLKYKAMTGSLRCVCSEAIQVNHSHLFLLA